jgi:hypothetical protein
MKLAIRARDVLRGILPALVDELDSLVNRINFVWNKEHDPDGAHGPVVTIYEPGAAKVTSGGEVTQLLIVPKDFNTFFPLVILNRTWSGDVQNGLDLAQDDTGRCFVTTGASGAGAGLTFGVAGSTYVFNNAYDVILDATAANTSVLIGNSPFRMRGYLFADLPSSPTLDDMLIVGDSSTATKGAVIAGSGANRVIAIYNGTDWIVV